MDERYQGQSPSRVGKRPTYDTLIVPDTGPWVCHPHAHPYLCPLRSRPAPQSLMDGKMGGHAGGTFKGPYQNGCWCTTAASQSTWIYAMQLASPRAAVLVGGRCVVLASAPWLKHPRCPQVVRECVTGHDLVLKQQLVRRTLQPQLPGGVALMPKQMSTSQPIGGYS